MKLNAYSVYDSKTQTFGTPFFSPNDRVATRSFERLVLDRNSSLSTHCNDYQLFRVGSFRDTNATIDDNEPSFLLNGEPLEMVKNGADYFAYITNQTEFPYV